jgi:hypothetical protein
MIEEMGWRLVVAVFFFLILVASVLFLATKTTPAVRVLPDVDQPPDVFTIPLHGQTPLVYSGKWATIGDQLKVVAPLSKFPQLAVDMSGNIVYPN